MMSLLIVAWLSSAAVIFGAESMAEQERLSALLLKVLTDPALTAQRQAGGDPWTFVAPNATWPNVRLYQNEESMRGDIGKMARTFPDPQLFQSFLESLRRGAKLPLAGFYDRPTNTMFAPYERNAIEHELEHFSYPEQKHPLFETLEEWKKRKQQKQSPPTFQFK